MTLSSTEEGAYDQNVHNQGERFQFCLNVV
jgi:hypothetical protein